MKRVVLGVVLSGLLACGGRVADPDPGGSGGGDPAPMPSGASGSGGKPGSTTPLPSHELGACTPGFNRANNPARACNWLTDSGLCFETNDDACSCICPQDRDSVCYSAFYGGPGGATLVRCD